MCIHTNIFFQIWILYSVSHKKTLIYASQNHLDVCKVSLNPLMKNHSRLKGINMYLEGDYLIKCCIIKLMHIEDN